jgi:integrase
MAKKILDEKKVAALRTIKPQADVFDGLVSGLCLRVTKSGRKTWTYHFKSPTKGKNARITLGTYPGLSLKDARDLAVANKAKVEKGLDPREETFNPDKTVAELIEDRLRLKVRPDIDSLTGKVHRPGLRSWKEIERRHNRLIIPIVGNVGITDFRITHLNRVVDPLTAKKKYRAAGMAHSDLQTLFNFAVSRGELEHNPLAKAEMQGSTGTPRKRFLTLQEIRTVWTRLPHVAAQSDHVPQIVKLCLIMGQRVGEVCGMLKSEIDPVERTWLIPGDRTKNEEPHLVPISPLAWEIIEEAWAETESDVLFPNQQGEAFDRKAVSRTIARVLEPTDKHPLGRLGVAKWTPHDLRRTVTTQMRAKSNGLKISHFDVGLVLNHVSVTKKTVTQRHYDVNEYLEEKREILEKWSDFLRRLLSSEPPFSDSAASAR